LLVRGRSPGDHEDFQEAFLASPWPDHRVAMHAAQTAYSVLAGGWMEKMNKQSAMEKYLEFRDKESIDLGTDFLRKQNIDAFRKSNRLACSTQTEAWP
jgi:hypothetical protein